MKNKKTSNIVCQYLENISRKALERYQKVIRRYVRDRHGVYALYRKNKLYYVGLASNLNSRLNGHLRDRHANVWDSFSVYLTVGGEHLHELETLLLRIIDRKGNKQRGKFGKAEDLKRKFRADLRKIQRDEFRDILGDGFFGESKKFKTKNKSGKGPSLADFVHKRFHIRFKYKGKVYVAHVRRNGTITFAADSAEIARLKDKVFKTPSAAAAAITGTTMDGWKSWQYERAPGDWVFLDELRK